jgi:hypothetical protein
MTKDPTQNIINIQLTVNPTINILSNLQCSNYFNLNNSDAYVSSCQFQNGQLTVAIQYNSSIQNQPISFSFVPPYVGTLFAL